MAYDTVGIRIGAANNQASNIVAALITAGHIVDADTAIVQHTLLADALYDAAESQQAKVQAAAPATPAAPAQFNAEQSLSNNLGASTATAPVKVITTKNGGQYGELPAWFITEAAEKGVEKVFDNRKAIEDGTMSARAPWFKSPKDAGDVAFWPPKS